MIQNVVLVPVQLTQVVATERKLADPRLQPDRRPHSLFSPDLNLPLLLLGLGPLPLALALKPTGLTLYKNDNGSPSIACLLDSIAVSVFVTIG